MASRPDPGRNQAMMVSRFVRRLGCVDCARSAAVSVPSLSLLD